MAVGSGVKVAVGVGVGLGVSVGLGVGVGVWVGIGVDVGAGTEVEVDVGGSVAGSWHALSTSEAQAIRTRAARFILSRFERPIPGPQIAYPG
jgi:hypothetical protein